MSKGLQWILGISAVLIALASIASTVLPFSFPQASWSGWQGMMGPGHMYGGGNMMGGFGMMPFFGIGMLLWPLLFVGLIVLGVVWLVRSVATPAAPQPPAASTVCAHCGKPLQAGWKTCPYCGEKV
jgi:predicted lipid-binding transport protein (Tim44 family)